MIKLYKGDCLIESDKIESGSVDLILTDLPYGTVKGLGNSRVAKEKKYNVSEWDITIDTEKIFEIANRILRKNGKMVLTANQPFTTELISNAIPNLPHSYNMYWDKMHFANCLIANKAPVSYIEDVLVFSKRNPKNDIFENPLRDYFKEQRDIIKELSYVDMEKKLNYRFSNQLICNKLSSYKKGWQFPTKNNYEMLQELGICTKDYEELKKIDDEFRLKMHFKENEKYPSTFNLWEGNKYKSNILKYKKDYDGHHPTQKPVLLLEDLIKTFSNENDLVVDLTMGSGSTGVACVNTNRNFIGIEMNDSYFEIAKTRTASHNIGGLFFSNVL